MALNYLLDPMFQIENSAGKPVTGGHLEVYLHGTRTKYYCASDFNGTLHPFKIKLDSLGSNIVLAEDTQSYDVYAYNRFGSLLMSRYNVQPGSGGGTGGTIGELQHWLGMYGPTYTPFPGDNAGHTLGISKWERDYVGDFIDRIETCPYPDGTTPEGYIYLKPGLYFVSCIIRYKQADDALSNTLDEVLMYTGDGNPNESLSYQMDSSGPEATGNRHNVRVQFIRKVPDNVSSSVLYFAPATPVNWREAYIQKLEIVKLDSVALSPTIVQGLETVAHDGTMTGDGTVLNPLSIQSALDNKQDRLVAGDNVTIDSDGVISAAGGETYTAGENIVIDSDNVISADYSGGYGIEIDGNVIKTSHHRLIATNNVQYTYCKVFDFNWEYVYGRGQCVFTATHYGGAYVTYAVSATRALGANFTIAWPYVVDASDDMVSQSAFIERLEIRSVGSRIVGYLKLRNFSQNQFWLDWEGSSEAGTLSFTPELTNSTEGDIEWTCEVNDSDVSYSRSYADNTFQEKLTPGNNITIDSDGVISASGGSGETYTAGSHISIDSENVISATGLQEELTAGEGIILDSYGNISVDKDEVQGKLTPGEGITIDSDGVISSDVQFEQVQADYAQNDSDAVDYIKNKPDLSLYATKQELEGKQDTLTPGNNITIDSDGVISASGGGQSYTAGSGIIINSEGVISVDPSALPTYDSLPIEAGTGISLAIVDGKLRISLS